jgi:hypothetical protein
MEAMSTNSRSNLSIWGWFDSQRACWAKAMSINTKLDMSLGDRLGRRGEIDEKPLNSH